MKQPRSQSAQKPISQRTSRQGLLSSTFPITTAINCIVCKQKYDQQHYPCIVCPNYHMACKKCVESQGGSSNDLKSTKGEQKQCAQCQVKYTKETVRPFVPYFQLCQYIRRFQQITKKQEMRIELKQIQAEQLNKLLKKENGELKKWIKEVSEKLREIQVGKKWNSSNAKGNEFWFELPDGDKAVDFEIIDGMVKKCSPNSFANIVGLQPIPKTGIHSFTIKVVSSLSGGSILYGLCTSEAHYQRYAWLQQGFIGYSGNDGDVISSGSWLNTNTLYYDGRKVRASDEITTIVDMNSKMVNWRINGGEFVTEGYVIPQHMRAKALFPIVVLQDGDRIVVGGESGRG